MSKQSLQQYFEKAKGIPLATSYESVEALVRLKGVSTAPPKKWWWNLNTLIMMTTTALLSTLAAIYFISPTKVSSYQATVVEPMVLEATAAEEELLMLNVVLAASEQPSPSKDESIALMPKKQEKVMQQHYDPLWRKAHLPIPMPEITEAESPFEALTETIPTQEAESKQEEAELTLKEKEEYDGAQKQIVKSLSAAEVKRFLLKSYKRDIRIHAWDQQEIKLVSLVQLKTKKKENEAMALEDFQLELKEEAGVVKVESNWEDIYACNCTTSKSKDEVKLANGEKVKVKDLKLEYDVYLPSQIALELSTSYGKVGLPDWNAKLKVRLFHADLLGGKIEDLEVSVNYGKLQMKDFKSLNGRLFHGGLELDNGETVDLKANYSKVKIGEVEQVDLEGFHTDASFAGIASELKTNFRYGKLVLASDLEQAKLKGFHAKMEVESIKQAEISFSYSSLNAADVEQLSIENAFQSKLNLQKVGSVSGKLKYTPLTLEHLENELELTSFRGNVEVGRLSPKLRLLKMTAKYTNLDFKLAENSSYQMRLLSNSARLDLLELDKSQSQNSGNRQEILSSHNPKADGNFTSQIDLNLFQGSLTLSE